MLIWCCGLKTPLGWLRAITVADRIPLNSARPYLMFKCNTACLQRGIAPQSLSRSAVVDGAAVGFLIGQMYNYPRDQLCRCPSQAILTVVFSRRPRVGGERLSPLSPSARCRSAPGQPRDVPLPLQKSPRFQKADVRPVLRKSFFQEFPRAPGDEKIPPCGFAAPGVLGAFIRDHRGLGLALARRPGRRPRHLGPYPNPFSSRAPGFWAPRPKTSGRTVPSDGASQRHRVPGGRGWGCPASS